MNANMEIVDDRFMWNSKVYSLNIGVVTNVEHKLQWIDIHRVADNMYQYSLSVGQNMFSNNITSVELEQLLIIYHPKQHFR